MGFRRRAPLFVVFVVFSLLAPMMCGAHNNLTPSPPGNPYLRSDAALLLENAYSLLDGRTPAPPGDIPEAEASRSPGHPAPVGGWKNVTTTNALSLDFPRMALADTYHVLTGPARWDKKDWLVFSGAALTVGALALLDRPVNDELRRLEEHNDGEWARQIRRFGGPYSFAALGLFYAGGLAFDNTKAKSVALDGAVASVIASGIVVPAVKFVVGRDRPSANNGAYAFRPFSSDRASFFSGEACQAFAVASVVAAHYDQFWVKSVSYGLASMVAVARLYQGGHFLSDIAAGAIVGTVIGRAVVHYNEKGRAAKEKKWSISVLPYFGGTSGGILLTVS
jgi:membrane-associated phospholipid phosphatase